MLPHQLENAASASFWKKLWCLPIPHKVRHFAWRVSRDILPTKENLCKRRILLENTCEECGTALEFSGHLFWSCTKAQRVWGCTKLPSSIRSSQFHSFFDLLWFLLMLESFDEEKKALMVTVAWSLWCNRNEIRYVGLRKSPEALVQGATHYLMEYAAATKIAPAAKEVLNVTWNPPPPSMFKINVDGATFRWRQKLLKLVSIWLGTWVIKI